MTDQNKLNLRIDYRKAGDGCLGMVVTVCGVPREITHFFPSRKDLGKIFFNCFSPRDKRSFFCRVVDGRVFIAIRALRLSERGISSFKERLLSAISFRVGVSGNALKKVERLTRQQIIHQLDNKV